MACCFSILEVCCHISRSQICYFDAVFGQFIASRLITATRKRTSFIGIFSVPLLVPSRFCTSVSQIVLIMHFVAIVNESAIDVNFYIGIILSIAGSLFSTVSLALQRLSHKRNEALPVEEQLAANRQKLNIIGVVFLFFGSLVDFAALGFAPATVISCMGSLTLVLNMILAPILIREAIFLRDVCVNFIVIIGTLISVWFGPHNTPEYDLEDLARLMKEPTFIMYQSMFGIWVLSLIVVWMDLRKDVDSPTYLTGLEAVTRRRLLRFSYPGLAGSIGGFTAAYAKASIELIKTSILGDNQFTHIGTYFIIFMMGGSVCLQIKFLNAGLKRYEAMYIVPVYQVFWIISGILAGMFYFHEVEGLSEKEVRLFSLGAGISITGIILHSKRSSYQDEEKSEVLKEDIELQKEAAKEILCKEKTYLLSTTTDEHTSYYNT